MLNSDMEIVPLLAPFEMPFSVHCSSCLDYDGVFAHLSGNGDFVIKIIDKKKIFQRGIINSSFLAAHANIYIYGKLYIK